MFYLNLYLTHTDRISSDRSYQERVCKLSFKCAKIEFKIWNMNDK